MIHSGSLRASLPYLSEGCNISYISQAQTYGIMQCQAGLSNPCENAEEMLCHIVLFDNIVAHPTSHICMATGATGVIIWSGVSLVRFSTFSLA